MNIPIFVIKLVLAPLIVAGVTLASRRWGEAVAGLLVGMPFTSGPISVFFALEQGRSFAAAAAIGSMLGLLPVVVFYLAYVYTARRFSWWLAALAGLLAYLAAVEALSHFAPGLGATAILVPLALAAGVLILGRPLPGVSPLAPPWWDLPLRMLVATALLVVITAAAGSLGPHWSGLLSPFPVFSFVMVTFAHRQGGTAAAWRFVRGANIGLFSYLAFFLVISALVERLDPWAAYALASTVALLVNGALLTLQLANRPAGLLKPVRPAMVNRDVHTRLR